MGYSQRLAFLQVVSSFQSNHTLFSKPSHAQKGQKVGLPTQGFEATVLNTSNAIFMHGIPGPFYRETTLYIEKYRDKRLMRNIIRTRVFTKRNSIISSVPRIRECYNSLFPFIHDVAWSPKASSKYASL